MICLPCKGCGADLGYDQWPWGDPFLPSRPYFWDGAAWCKTCYDKIRRNDLIIRIKGGDAMQIEDAYTPSWQLPGASVLTG